jgi:hypothetical protein
MKNRRKPTRPEVAFHLHPLFTYSGTRKCFVSAAKAFRLPLRSRIAAIALTAIAFISATGASAAPTPDGKLAPAEIRLDMVHNNPGEAPFNTHYNDPRLLKKLGYTGKVFELFQAAQFGVDWAKVDPEMYRPGTPERAWVDAKATELNRLYDETKAAGLEVYCHTDMIILPKQLVERRHLKDMGDITDPDTQACVRELIHQMFVQFPQRDGLVVRIGETYLQGAPYHVGKINQKTDPAKTIIPLMNLLREEVCVKLNKKLIFRSWLSFDVNAEAYQAVSNGVEPHPNLFIVVKHCEGDFHRGNPFSKVLGLGRHRQIVEIQCQREYEGKGAYPNYVANGIIEGFEEHREAPIKSVRQLWSNPLVMGIFTWSRGGGWEGPYLTNELWCDLNVYVVSQWAQNPNRSEADIFAQYCREALQLEPEAASKFRQLSLLSADAVYRGKRSTHNDINPVWSRDNFISPPPLPKDPVARDRVVAQKDEAVELWQKIVALGDAVKVPDSKTDEFLKTSTRYGLYLYRIYEAGFHLAALGERGPRAELDRWLAVYDQGWADLRALKAKSPSCATLYKDIGFQNKPSIGKWIEAFRPH